MKASKKEFIKMWTDRIKEIKETGNCMNGNVHNPNPYFGGTFKSEGMIEFCKDRIKIIKDNY
jgi:hypothetical protein